MALDGIVLNKLVYQIKDKVEGKKVNKISIANGDMVIFDLRDSNLLISANPSYPRLYITDKDFSKDEKQSNFGINLRKYLQGAILTEVKQIGIDRIIEINFDALNDFKERVNLKLILEVMGKYSNLILTDSDYIIIDSYKHVTNFISSKRTILPKIKYERVLDDNKLDITNILSMSDDDKDNVLNMLCDSYNKMIGHDSKLYLKSNIINLLSNYFLGVSKCVCESFIIDNISNIDNLSDDDVNMINSNIKMLLIKFIVYISDLISNDEEKDKTNIKYQIYFDKDEPKDFHVTNLSYYLKDGKYTSISYDDLSQMISKFYDKKAINNSLKCKSQDLKNLLTNIMHKDIKKKQIHHRVINESKNNETNKMYGDLIFSNIYQMHKGDKELICNNFYDGNLEITIPLDENLTPQENANRYYKKYNKTKSALKNSIMQLEEIDKEIVYLETVISYLDNATCVSDIDTIREELEIGGYLKKKILLLKNKGNNKNKNKSNKEISKPYKFISSDGHEIYVGKNNIQNDEITFKVGKDSDVWLHVQDIPGSHVIIKTQGEGLDSISDDTLLEAANLGVYFSKGRESAKVPIDYVERRYVKKPSGAKPGFVIFVNNKTLFITPNKDILKKFNIDL